MFRKFYGRGVPANISKLKSNIKHYVENEIKKVFWETAGPQVIVSENQNQFT